MTQISRNLEEPFPSRVELRTSVYSLFFEPETAFARRITVGGVEVLRAIYAAVRDHHWSTAVPRVSNIDVDQQEDAFLLTFDANCKLGEVDFFYRGSIRGRGGEFAFSFDGEARSAFRRNRIGFCVLHPVEGCAGNPCELLKADGSREQSAFPDKISPRQPFLDLRGMRWEPAPGLDAALEFSGDVFETEDQRNWTDASFKTYCTPLSLPKPVEVLPGTRVRQEVTLRISGLPAERESAAGDFCTVTVAGPSGLKLPPIGFGMARHGQPLDPRSAELLKALDPAHLRADLHLHKPGWKEELRRAATDASAIGAALHCALFVSDSMENELADFAAEALQAGARINACFIFHPAEPVTATSRVELAKRRLRHGGLDVEILGGTNSYFTDLNRNRTEPGKPVVFSFNPQVHAFDNLSLVENIEGQAHVVASATEFAGAPVAISPVTLLPRGSSNADARQRTDFGAVWTLASLATLGNLPGIHSLTYYETTGCCGLIETAEGSCLPGLFPSSPGEIFPMYRVFEAVAGCRELLEVRGGRARQTAALGVIAPDGRARLLIGNLLPEPQTISIQSPGGRPVTAHLPAYGLEIMDLGSYGHRTGLY